MKFLIFLSFMASLNVVSTQYLQLPMGNTSFTEYGGCQDPACGVVGSGFTAAINQLAFGSVPGIGAGGACGRCFSLTGTEDPFDPIFTGPFNTVIVQVTDMCPVQGNEPWCGQTVSEPINSFGTEFHFDLCLDNGAAQAFFPSGHYALLGNFFEVDCSLWVGSDGPELWEGACINSTAGLWPDGVGCANQGAAPGGTAPPTTPTSPAGSAPTGSTQSIYGQCGGISWTGPTVCASGSICIASSIYYSQCLPPT